MTRFLLILHILLFAFSFAFTAGISILLDRVAARRDVKIIHAAFSEARPLSIAGGLGWLVTGLTGAALASTMGYDWGTPWLVATYATFAVLLLTGIFLHSPWQAKVIAASAAGGGEPSEELDAVLKAPVHLIATGVSSFCVILLLLLMTMRWD